MLKRIELLDKYNIPGGRYTYFPFHSKWNNSLSFEQFVSHLKEAQPEFVDCYIHIPFCHSLCTFCGCNVKIMKSDCDNNVYINYLLKEWQLYPQQLKIKNLFLGGGTPNFLKSSELKTLIKSLPLTDDVQITIELDPRFLSKEDLSEYKNIGIKRLSIGIQDFDPEVLKSVNREQDINKIIDLINYASELKFENINLDFIYGLGRQTINQFKNSISRLKEVKANSISLYPFAKVPWQNNFQKAFGEMKDFSMHEMNEFFVESSYLLEEMGFQNIGMGYFSKNEFQLKRNIMGFTPRREDFLIGLGVSSISSSPRGHIQNEKVYDRYLGLIKENNSAIIKSHQLTQSEFERQQFYQMVICQNEITKDQIELFKTPLFDLKISQFIEDGLLIKKGDNLIIPAQNRFFHKTILQLFDPHFN